MAKPLTVLGFSCPECDRSLQVEHIMVMGEKVILVGDCPDCDQQACFNLEAVLVSLFEESGLTIAPNHRN